MTNTKNSTLSVGIPTYNQATYLPATLDSLLNQTRPPDEIVVSDHQSTDNTLEILHDYAPRFPNFRIVSPRPGTNLTAQYNFTLASQTADWITIFNSDDIAYPNYCETLHRAATANPEAALIRAGWEQVDEQGTPVSTHYLLSVPKIQPAPENLTTQKHGPMVNGTAFAIRREAYIQSGPIHPSMESLVDWALFLQVTPYGPFVYEHALIAGYRVGHDGNKFRDRLPLWTRDQQRIFTEVMPLAAKRCGMTSPGGKDLSWIDEASLYNFTRYLATASREFAPDSETRTPIVALFQPWANSLNQKNAASAQALLKTFAAGKPTPTSLPISRRIKNTLRPIYQRFHSVFRHD